ncbi:hypothetical protein F5Y14DRAFT_392657 [Nemania sp. NC0429]|nr:hypothetical protein F5Y14DRAFT_392657 [Nemania sp. NC0429]
MPPKKTKKRGLGHSPDLPGLFPTHDGSYGINTLVNIDPESGKGHKPNSSIARENSDDKKWMESMQSKVAKKYGMNTDLKKAIDQSHKEVEEEQVHGQPTFETPYSPTEERTISFPTTEKPTVSYPTTEKPTMVYLATEQPPMFYPAIEELDMTYPTTEKEKPTMLYPTTEEPILFNPPAPSRPSNHAISHSSVSSRSGGSAKLSEPLEDHATIQPLAPHIPTYNPNNPPFSEEYDDRPRPPYMRAELPLTNSRAHAGFAQPISSPSDSIPFYGIPQGEGSTEPITPARPDSSRSFSFESGLFANATVQTPRQPTGLFGTSRTTTQAPGTAQRQTAAQLGVSGIPGAGGLPTSQPPSGMQPSSRGQPPSGRPTPGLQPIPERRPIPVGRPITSMQPILPKPPISRDKPRPSVQPIKQPVLGGQPILGETPTTNARPASAQEPSLGGQPTPSGVSDHHRLRGEPNPPKSSTILEVPQIEKVLTTGTNKQGFKKKVAPTTTVPLSAKTFVQRNLTGGERGSDRRRRRVWPSSDLFWRSTILFLALVMTLWFAFSTIPIELSDYDNFGLPRASNALSNFSIGSAWKTISDLLPEIPNIHSIVQDISRGTPRGPWPSDINKINSDEVLQKVEKSMPETVWVQKNRSGKPKIPEDFWYALRQLVEEDDSLLSLENSEMSEDVWRTIKSRIQSSEGSEAGITTEDMKGLVEKTVHQSWDSWLEKNDQAIKNAIVGVSLTKDDFMKLFQQEISSYENQIRQEFRGLQERIQVMSQQMIRLQENTGPSDQITKDEVTNIINSVVSKAISNVKLDAVAHGLIKGHQSDVLANQVDFFGSGSGAAIDSTYSSNAWVPKNDAKLMSKKFLDRDGYKPMPPRAALSPWSEEGECFCAKPDNKGYGVGTNNISVILSRNIVPQHLVVEHILPGATLDPGAMPRDIEVWAYIEETNLRNEVRTFSEAQFPDTPKEEVLNDGFVKIGHFTYKNNTGDEVQVFKMSDELTFMNAITAWAVIRAINNYGADHTCFYRLKIYGEVVERPDDPPDSTYEGRSDKSWFGMPV